MEPALLNPKLPLRANMVHPRAIYAPANVGRLVILEAGENPTTDTYLRPRTRAAEAPPAVFVDLRHSPQSAWPGAPVAGKTFVIIVRYITTAWIRFLRAHSHELAGVAYFADDDIAAAIADTSLPLRYRLRLMARYGRHVEALSDLVSELWVSTKPLAERYADRHPIQLPQLFVPGGSPVPDRAPMVRYFYHGTASHGREQRFLVDVVAEVQKRRPNTVFEVFGKGAVERLYRGIERVVIHRPTTWNSYLAHTTTASAHIGLAPLLPSRINESRSITKYYDITRMGAAGVYSDAIPYRDVITHGETGLLLPNEPEAWVRAILQLVDDEAACNAIATQALQHCRDSMYADLPFAASRPKQPRKPHAVLPAKATPMRRIPDHLERKLRKLQREPARFFEDAKHPWLRHAGALGLMAERALRERERTPRVLRDQLTRRLRPRNFRINALQQLVARDNHFTSTGDNPIFGIEAKPRLPCGGWTRVELELSHLDDLTTPKLIVSHGRSYSATTTISLPATTRGERLIHMALLPEDITSLRLVPMTRRGTIGIAHVHLQPVTVAEAFAHLSKETGKSNFAVLETMNRYAQCLETTTRDAAAVEQRALTTLRQSPLFDAEFYLRSNRDVAEAGTDPALHYLRYGAAEGRNPSPTFDTRAYQRMNPDVVQAGINPLVHYIRYGQKEGRRVDEASGPPAKRPVAPPMEAFEQLARRPRVALDAPRVDIILPVYAGYDDTLACVYSVLTSRNKTPYELIVINDHSPDPRLSTALRRLASLSLFTLLENDSNQGFVRTANRGMALHDDRDVLLLNSDTLVYHNFLDRLIGHTQKSEDIGSVCPLSNNATICSYPRASRNNQSQLELSFSDLDALMARENSGEHVELPTSIGFCMLITRDCLRRVGLFDAERFGRGYGEENDFCQRALAKGLRSVAACDVFVRHTGAVSFADTALEAQQRALKTMSELHPNFQADVAAFVTSDPLQRYRKRIDLARLTAGMRRPTTLVITHSRGGGVERHLREQAAELSRRGQRVLSIQSNARGELMLCGAGDLDLPNLNPLPRDLSSLAELLQELSLTQLHVHSLADYPLSMLSMLPELSRRLSIPYDFTFHDYLPLCPRTNLVDPSGRYCGEPGVSGCRTCLADGKSAAGTLDILTWRARYQELLQGARQVYAPSHDTAARVRRHFPDLPVQVVPHELLTPLRRQPPRRHPQEPLRVAVIGAIGPHKGSQVLLAAAKDAQTRRLPLQFVVVGYTNLPELSRLPNVTVTGRYADDHEAAERVREHGCHLAWFPSICPETYNYTLSLALKEGLPAVAFDLGALPERLRAAGTGNILPLSLSANAGALNTALLDVLQVTATTQSHRDL